MDNLNHDPGPVYRIDGRQVVLCAEIYIFKHLFDWNIKIIWCPFNYQQKDSTELRIKLNTIKPVKTEPP